MARYIDGFFVTAGLFVATFLLTGLTEMSLWLRALTALLALCAGAAIFAAIVKRNSGGADTRDFVTYCALEPSFAEKVFEATYPDAVKQIFGRQSETRLHSLQRLRKVDVRLCRFAARLPDLCADLPQPAPTRKKAQNRRRLPAAQTTSALQDDAFDVLLAQKLIPPRRMLAAAVRDVGLDLVWGFVTAALAIAARAAGYISEKRNNN